MTRRFHSFGGVPEVALRACLSDRRGLAAVEFGLLAPVMTTLALGLVDFGAMIYQSMEVEAAAHAGADYAMHSGWNATAVAAAVTGATSLTVSASPAPAQESACVVGGALVATTNATCASGAAPGSYVVVYAQATFTAPIPWSAFGLPTSLTAQAMVRIG